MANFYFEYGILLYKLEYLGIDAGHLFFFFVVILEWLPLRVIGDHKHRRLIDVLFLFRGKDRFP
ncbi:hypothetical protein SDC9_157303 [bioreactor metagenome]|uniref:Uncharacterized protein n=1 Tax=bioreactor metagenome TaxID=1076179 RepID=A0A645F7X8_9ZZZZ